MGEGSQIWKGLNIDPSTIPTKPPKVQSSKFKPMAGLCVRCWFRSPDVFDIWPVCPVVGLLTTRKIRLFTTAWSPPSMHAVTARVTALRLAPGFCFAGLVVLQPATQPATQPASEQAISPSVFFEIDRVCGFAGP